MPRVGHPVLAPAWELRCALVELGGTTVRRPDNNYQRRRGSARRLATTCNQGQIRVGPLRGSGTGPAAPRNHYSLATVKFDPRTGTPGPPGNSPRTLRAVPPGAPVGLVTPAGLGRGAPAPLGVAAYRSARGLRRRPDSSTGTAGRDRSRLWAVDPSMLSSSEIDEVGDGPESPLSSFIRDLNSAQAPRAVQASAPAASAQSAA